MRWKFKFLTFQKIWWTCRGGQSFLRSLEVLWQIVYGLLTFEGFPLSWRQFFLTRCLSWASDDFSWDLPIRQVCHSLEGLISRVSSSFPHVTLFHAWISVIFMISCTFYYRFVGLNNEIVCRKVLVLDELEIQSFTRLRLLICCLKSIELTFFVLLSLEVCQSLTILPLFVLLSAICWPFFQVI